MEKKITDYQVITARFYSLTFGCSYATAKAWYKEDLKMLQRRRLTLTQFNFLYGTCEPLNNSTNRSKRV